MTMPKIDEDGPLVINIMDLIGYTVVFTHIAFSVGYIVIKPVWEWLIEGY